VKIQKKLAKILHFSQQFLCFFFFEKFPSANFNQNSIFHGFLVNHLNIFSELKSLPSNHPKHSSWSHHDFQGVALLNSCISGLSFLNPGFSTKKKICLFRLTSIPVNAKYFRTNCPLYSEPKHQELYFNLISQSNWLHSRCFLEFWMRELCSKDLWTPFRIMV